MNVTLKALLSLFFLIFLIQCGQHSHESLYEKPPPLPEATEKSLDEEFVIAAINGHQERLEELLAQGADVNFTYQNGRTALIEATRRFRISLVRFLMAQNADPSIADADGQTAFDYAADNEKITRILNGNEESYEEKNQRLLAAVNEENSRLVNELIADGADCNYRAPSGAPIIIIAANNGSLAIVGNLSRQDGLEINACGCKHKTAFTLAEEQGQTRLAEFLRRFGATSTCSSLPSEGVCP